MEPEKPFACSLPDCGMTFTNEDHLHVHTKKHDMVLQLGIEQKAAFVADQTPTPTRFIRNCEEVGLFQDLQNVNPFDEGFKRAMEIKHGHSETPASSVADDGLHTPHMMFPIIDPGDCASYSTTNNHRNITISRSSSDESGAVKEYETTTISKLTNEVTTISRVVGKDVLDRVTTTDDVSIVRHEETARNRDGVNETSVSYTNNVIKFHSNVEIRKDGNLLNLEKTPVLRTYTDSVIKDNKDDRRLMPEKVPPIMSQKSLDFVVDSLTSECNADLDKDTNKCLKRNYNLVNKDKPKANLNEKNDNITEDYEVIIKLPNGRQVRMKGVEDDIERTIQKDTKEKLKKSIKNKANKYQRIANTAQIVPSILPVAGTLIPVTIVNPILQQAVPKIPIVPFSPAKSIPNYKTVKRKVDEKLNQSDNVDSTVNNVCDDRSDCIVIDDDDDKSKPSPKSVLESRSAASRRYRERLKESMRKQTEENRQLHELNQKLIAEKALLKLIITEHLKKCPVSDELRNIHEKLQRIQ
ncbi:uncharacterized protein Atf-2 [Epargyreus clarus]|uniref:uncharacterized protein Atf-2 n=1 Tax=Epargyreus clarus TaxID=520877 RepID=UPI003C2F06BD